MRDRRTHHVQPPHELFHVVLEDRVHVHRVGTRDIWVSEQLHHSHLVLGREQEAYQPDDGAILGADDTAVVVDLVPRAELAVHLCRRAVEALLPRALGEERVGVIRRHDGLSRRLAAHAQHDDLALPVPGDDEHHDCRAAILDVAVVSAHGDSSSLLFRSDGNATVRGAQCMFQTPHRRIHSYYNIISKT